MDLKSGYQPASLPEGWEHRSVRDFAQIQTGPFGTLLKASEYSETEGVPLISVGEIRNGSFRISESTPLIPEAVVRRLPQYILHEGDIVFGRKGAVERSALVTEHESGWFLGSDGISIRPSREFDPSYLAWQFQSHALQSWLIQNATGTTMASLNQATLEQVEVPYAPLPEQRAIAEVLGDVAAFLSGLDRIIVKKCNLKQAVMQQLLTGQTRLPGFSGVWKVKRIGEFTDCAAGGTPSTRIAAYWNGTIPWMSSGELNYKQVYEVEGRITDAGLANSSTRMVPIKCVLIGLAGQGKTRGTAAMNHIKLCTNQSIAAIFPNEFFVSEYLYYNIDSRYDELREMSAGDGGRGGLNLKIIRSIALPFPSVKEQAAIATVLSDMDAELTALEARRNKIRNLMQAMMQELLTGKTRLVPAGDVHA